MKTKEEIEKKIQELVCDEDNFTSNNFGSFGADNGHYEVSFSEFASERSLKEFVNWLTDEKIFL